MMPMTRPSPSPAPNGRSQPVEATAPTGESGSSFGSMLGDSIQSLAKTQNDASAQSRRSPPARPPIRPRS